MYCSNLLQARLFSRHSINTKNQLFPRDSGRIHSFPNSSLHYVTASNVLFPPTKRKQFSSVKSTCKSFTCSVCRHYHHRKSTDGNVRSFFVAVDKINVCNTFVLVRVLRLIVKISRGTLKCVTNNSSRWATNISDPTTSNFSTLIPRVFSSCQAE